MRLYLTALLLPLLILCVSCRSARATREAVLKQNLTGTRVALDKYHADKGKFPRRLEDLVSSGYLSQVPLDPITERSDTWVFVFEEPGTVPEGVPLGIYDVKSGAHGTTLEGEAYGDL